MKTLFVLPLATVLVVALLLAGAAALEPDLIIPSEVWELDTTIWLWDVRVCEYVVYFAGPLAVEDGTDCNQEWVVVARDKMLP